MSKALTAADLLRGGDNPYRKVEIPELTKDGDTGHVYVKDLPAGDVLVFTEMPEGPERNEGMMFLIAKALVDEDGNPLFTSEEEVREIKNVSMNVFNRLAQEVTGVRAEATEGNG